MSLKHIKLKHNYNLSKKTMSLTNIRGESGSLFKRVFTLVISNSPISHWRLRSLFKRVFTLVISNSPIFHWRFKFKVGRIWELPFHHSNYITGTKYNYILNKTQIIRKFYFLMGLNVLDARIHCSKDLKIVGHIFEWRDAFYFYFRCLVSSIYMSKKKKKLIQRCLEFESIKSFDWDQIFGHFVNIFCSVKIDARDVVLGVWSPSHLIDLRLK